MKTLLPDYDAEALSASLFEEWRPATAPRVILSAAARYDRRELEVPPDLRRGLDSGLKEEYSAVTGLLGAIYKLHAGTSLALNIGRGWRHPSEFELFAAGLHDGVAAYERGNPDLREESNLGAELSLRVQRASFSSEVTVFRNDFSDYIYLYETNEPPIAGLPVMSFAQADATIQGIEAGGTLKLTAKLQARASYEHLRTENETTGRKLPFSPPDRATLGLRLGGRLGSMDAYVDVLGSWTGKGEPSGPDEPFGSVAGVPITTPDYVTADLASGVKWSLTRARIGLDLAVTNVADRRYVNFLDTYKQYYPAPSRGVRLTASFEF
jgi:outer membrane receptor protein involved in Fe transport